MSNQSIADTLNSTIKKIEKSEKPGSGVVAPPHFGDLGKAANDTFGKVIHPLTHQFYQLDAC
jgi:hypothetical protein